MNFSTPLRASRPRPPQKIVSAAEAVKLVRAGDTVALGGFVGIGVAEEIVLALEALFLDGNDKRPEAERPPDLSLLFGAAQGDRHDRGSNHLAHEGLVRRVIGGHWPCCPSCSNSR